MSRLPTIAALPLLIVLSSACSAQAASAPRLDLAATFQTTHLSRANSSQTSWTGGGAFTLGANVWHGFGIAAQLSGRHTSSIGNSGIPFSDVIVAFGPRFRYKLGRKSSVFVQGLIGEGDAFNGYFPANGSPLGSTNSLAAKATLGFDYSLSKRLAWRAVEAGWVHTSYPNSTDNQQDYLELGTGIVFKFTR